MTCFAASWFPGRDFVSNWRKATMAYNLPLFFSNSLKIALLTVVFGVGINAMAAFRVREVPL